jgi:type IV pilus assembly protein PilC
MPQITRIQISELLRDLALLTNNGVTLKEALSIIQRGSGDNLPLRSLVKHIADDVDQGRSFADSLAQHPQYFPPFLCNFVRRYDDDFPIALEKIAAYREQSDASDVNLSTRFKLALIYPALVLLIGLVVISMMLIYVVPVFSQMFEDFGGVLPVPTNFVLSISHYWYVLVIAFLAIVVLLFAGGIFETLRRRLLLQFFSLGNLYRYTIMSRLLYTWAFLLDNGISVKEAVNAAPEAVEDRYFASIMRRVAAAVNGGQHIIDALEAERQIPRKVVYAIEAGLRSEQTAIFLRKQAANYAERARLMVEPAMRVVWVVLLLILWLIIGFFVIAMYMPILNMGAIV